MVVEELSKNYKESHMTLSVQILIGFKLRNSVKRETGLFWSSFVVNSFYNNQSLKLNIVLNKSVIYKHLLSIVFLS